MDVDWPVMVDVRDVARAHVLALTEKKAEGERFIVNAESFVYSDVSFSSSSVWMSAQLTEVRFVDCGYRQKAFPESPSDGRLISEGRCRLCYDICGQSAERSQ